jgi:ribosome-associated translation inhibitor RaiA
MMHIQVNTDSNVTGHAELENQIIATVESRLARFRDYVTRVEVHVGDESAGRMTPADKRCTIEARPAGRPPVAVSSHATTVIEALNAAVSKLATVLARELDRREHKGAASIRKGKDSAATATPDRSDDSEDGKEHPFDPGTREEYAAESS